MGAAIAAGSHAEKGIWALFVIAASMISNETVSSFKSSGVKDHTEKLKSPRIINQAIESKTQTSPTRLDKTVSIPALLDFLDG